MSAAAQAPASVRPQLCERDPEALAGLRPCRFCGRADLLAFHPEYDEWVAYDADLLKLDAKGEVEVETYDAVECLSCCVVAPYAVWQSTGDVFAGAQREAYAAFARGQGMTTPSETTFPGEPLPPPPLNRAVRHFLKRCMVVANAHAITLSDLAAEIFGTVDGIDSFTKLGAGSWTPDIGTLGRLYEALDQYVVYEDDVGSEEMQAALAQATRDGAVQ